MWQSLCLYCSILQIWKLKHRDIKQHITLISGDWLQPTFNNPVTYLLPRHEQKKSAVWPNNGRNSTELRITTSLRKYFPVLHSDDLNKVTPGKITVIFELWASSTEEVLNDLNTSLVTSASKVLVDFKPFLWIILCRSMLFCWHPN